jgi:transcription initiation factor TFIID subunit 2
VFYLSSLVSFLRIREFRTVSLAPMTQSFKSVPHTYMAPSSPDAARCWVPCIDNLWEKCTWEFEFVVPRYLEEISVEDDEPTDASPTLVVCSRELVEQVCNCPSDLNQC